MKAFSLRLALLALLLSPAPLRLAAADSTNDLTAGQIVQQARAAYAKLTSYRDAGKSVTTMGSLTAASFNFTIQLARTNLYKVVWWQGEESFTPKGAVWSAGNGNYLWMAALGATARKEQSQELAIASATGISGGAAASIPGTFFKMNWGGVLAAATQSARLPDEKIGDADCFVLKSDAKGRTNILWIAKSDFLLRQIENDVSGTQIKNMMEEQAKNNAQVRNMLAAAGTQMFQDTRMVETHEAIKVNEPVAPGDFDFQVPAAKP
jgi:hypothetical protein